MKKYLITGGEGFIGSNLVRRLVKLKENKEIFLMTKPNSDLWRIRDILSELNIFEVDLTDFKKVNFLVNKIKPEIIFHLAAYGIAPNHLDQSLTYLINFNGTVNLLNSCKQVGFKCFVNTGSSSEYGTKDLPMKEDDCLEPVNDYGVSKAAATQFCLKESLVNDLPVYTVRLFTAFGDFEMQGRLITSILTGFLKGKEIHLSFPHFVRDFIYVDDVVDLYIKLSEKKPKKSYIFNCGTGVQTSIGEVLDVFQSLVDKKLDVKWQQLKSRPWEPKSWVANIGLAERVVGWKPKYDLKKGLKKSLEWFSNNLHFYDIRI